MILELDTEGPPCTVSAENHRHPPSPPSPSAGRYLLLNAVANQLRYPNSHTHYFSCCLLALFSETNTEAIQEQITRQVHSMLPWRPCTTPVCAVLSW